ncbi:OSJNBa0042D13.18 protein, related [Eimeria praecox]|uniref:OSJNBa0042D13.18 protein, related n=1 Tax=Eimeria praecox TaxID=51316 RepID=U6H268_9EIME|nr:OSJNBa0042D13.18 protein, related [Eimeria praecox]
MSLTGGNTCLVPTGPNAILVSPNWRQRLFSKGSPGTPGEDSRHIPSTSKEPPAPPRTTEEQSCPATGRCEESAQKLTREYAQRNENDRASNIHWWREGTPLELAHEGNGSLCGTGKTAVLTLEIAGYECEGLLDTGASRSFISPTAAERLGLRVRFLRKACAFTVANGELLHMDHVVTRLSMICGGERFTGDFLVGPIPYDVILWLDWLINHRVAWYFQSDKLRTYVNGRWCELPVRRKSEGLAVVTPATEGNAKTPADRAYDALAQQVSRVTAEEDAALLRPPHKRYKSQHRAGERVKIKNLLREARSDTEKLKRALDGLHFIAALPKVEAKGVVYLPTERQSPLMCAILEHHRAKTWSPGVHPAVVDATADADTEASPWPTAKLEYTEFDAWSQGHEAGRLPPQIFTVLQQHRLLFPHSLPDGLPPRRPYDHQILSLPGKLPTKSPIYKMPPDQLAYHTREIASLTSKGWIGPTCSPICASTIMVDKHDDGSGERKMRMGVNYQALNAVSTASGFPIPNVQTILESMGGAKYFSTLALEAGFHQIRMTKEDRWRTAFRSVQGLLEYKVMPFGLKGAPATFQANINAYLQPLLEHGVIACLNNVLICSPTIDTRVSLLRHVLSTFLEHQFYPKFAKCKFAQQELTYLGYTIGAEGIKPSVDKVQAILLWPDVLANETQVRQFLSTVNYCRMFMGLAFADTARPLVELTRQGTPFFWGAPHTAAVRRLKKLLAEYTTLQIRDLTRPYTLYTDASGYADLTISCLQGARNQVADALSRHPKHMSPAIAPALPAGGAAQTSPFTPLQPGGNPLTSRYPTMGKPRDYRADAGIHTRRARRPAAVAASPPPGAALISPPRAARPAA